MFGTANQLLAGIALCVGTTFIINIGKARYAWVTIIPMAFVMATTLSASWLNITDNFLPLAKRDGFAIQGYVNSLLTAVMMICAVIILIDSFRTWYKVLFVEKKEVRISKEEVVSE
jgi:carbon starvation protein